MALHTTASVFINDAEDGLLHDYDVSLVPIPSQCLTFLEPNFSPTSNAANCLRAPNPALLSRCSTSRPVPRGPCCWLAENLEDAITGTKSFCVLLNECISVVGLQIEGRNWTGFSGVLMRPVLRTLDASKGTRKISNSIKIPDGTRKDEIATQISDP